MKTSFSQQCHDPITRFKNCLFLHHIRVERYWSFFFISIDWVFTIKTSLWFIIKNRTQWTRTSMDIKAIFHQYEPPDWMFVIMMVKVKFLISLNSHEEFFFTWTREKVNGTRWILDEFTVVHDYKTLVTQRLINHKTLLRYFTIEKTRLIVLLEVKI